MASFLTDNVLVQGAAETFAREFKKQGLFAGGGTASSQDRETEQLIKKEKKTRKDARAELEAQLRTNRKYHTQLRTLVASQKDAEDMRKIIAEDTRKANIAYRKQIVQIADNDLGKFKEALNTADNAVMSTAKRFFSLDSAVALWTTAVVQGANDFRAQMKYNAAATGSFTDQMKRAADLGVDPALLSELQSQSRASVLAMGGVESWHQNLLTSQKALYNYIGDLDETTRFMTDSLQTMRLAGIDPTTQALTDNKGNLVGLGKTYSNIAKMSGQTFQQVNEMMRNYVDSEEVRMRLSSTLDKRQRANILQEIAHRHQLLLGLGMTAEQAQAAGKALEQMAGKGPMDRIKQAAKLRAVGGAMGMGTEANRAADIMIKGQRASAAEQAELVRIMGQMNQNVAASKTATLQGEITTSAMMQKLGMDFSQFNTTLGDSYKEQQRGAKDTKTVAESNSELAGTMYEASRILKIIKDNPLLKAIAGSVALLGPMTFMIGSIKASVAAIAARMAVPGGMGGAGKGFGGKVKAVGKLLGKLGAVAAVGVGAFDTLLETAQESSKNAAGIGESLFGAQTAMAVMSNKILSGLRNIGDIASFGFADDLGEMIGGKLYDWFGDKPDFTVTPLPTPKAEVTNMHKMLQKFSEAQKNMEPDETKMLQQDENYTKMINLLTAIANSTNGQNQITSKHLQLAAQMAEDGKLTAEETKRMAEALDTPDFGAELATAQ